VEIMSGIVEGLLSVESIWVYVLVAALVFAEDAIFVGFVIPGETAAVLGGVDASRGHVSVVVIALVVVLAAIVGDTVGYEVGKHLVGPRLLGHDRLRRHHRRIHDAQDFLARRGGWAVFLGRFTAFFRAVMPALAGSARMPYPRFLAFNAFGGVVWGIGFVVLGYLAGSSYKTVEQQVGRGAAFAAVGLLVVALVVLHLRRRRADRSRELAD
jgi:membrane protein DedA with SNARE-associated domain